MSSKECYDMFPSTLLAARSVMISEGHCDWTQLQQYSQFTYVNTCAVSRTEHFFWTYVNFAYNITRDAVTFPANIPVVNSVNVKWNSAFRAPPPPALSAALPPSPTHSHLLSSQSRGSRRKTSKCCGRQLPVRRPPLPP